MRDGAFFPAFLLLNVLLNVIPWQCAQEILSKEMCSQCPHDEKMSGTPESNLKNRKCSYKQQQNYLPEHGSSSSCQICYLSYVFA